MRIILSTFFCEYLKLFTLKHSRFFGISPLKHSRFYAETLPHSIYTYSYKYKKTNSCVKEVVDNSNRKPNLLLTNGEKAMLRNLKMRVSTLKNAVIGASIFLLANSAFADDILAEPTKDVFDTFAKTGINLLLLVEISAAAYLFSTQSRKMSTWIGVPTVLMVTSFAKMKFGV